MIRNYFKIAWRNLMNNKSHSLINISGLAIGIAVCLMIFTIIQFETSFDKYHKNESRVYRLLTEYHHVGSDVFYLSALPYALPEELKNSFPEFEQISTVFSDGNDQILVLDDNGNPVKKFKEESGVFLAEPALFDILDYKWLAGTAISLKDPNNVVLAKETAIKYFEDWENAIGKSIKWNNKETLTVTGILETIPTNTDLQFKAVIAYGTGYTSRYIKSDDWDGSDGSFGCFVLLKPNISEASVNERLKALSVQKKSEGNNDSHVIQSINKVHYDARAGNYSGKTISHKLINILWIIGGFILLIACINFINLSTAQAVNRSKEIGVRKVLGSTKTQLKGQFLTETFLIVIISMFIASFIVFTSLPIIGKVLDLPLSFEALLNLKALFILLGASVIITFLAGLYPSVVLAKFNPITALKNQTKTGNAKGVTLRRSLVVFQFAIAQVLIIATLIIVKQMSFFSSQSMGYNKDAIINVSIPTDSIGHSKIDYLTTALLTIKGIENVSFSSNTPTEYLTNSWTNFNYNNAPDDTEFYSIRKGIDHEYLPTYKLELVAGRNIKKSEITSEFIVNQDLVKRLGINDPEEILNKEISMWDGQIAGSVVGVIKDYHSSTFKDGMSAILMTNQKRWFRQAGIKLGTNDISSVIASIEKLWNKTYPNYAFEYQFLDTKIANFYAQEQRLSQMYQLFAMIAIFLSCLGLYGLASFMAVQRIKEVGIRKVLGASLANIVYLFSKEFITLITIGFAIAAPVAWYFMNDWLLGYTYRIDLSLYIFMVGGLLSLVVALITVGFQAVKAALANPVNSLKTE